MRFFCSCPAIPDPTWLRSIQMRLYFPADLTGKMRMNDQEVSLRLDLNRGSPDLQPDVLTSAPSRRQVMCN